MMIGDSN